MSMLERMLSPIPLMNFHPLPEDFHNAETLSLRSPSDWISEWDLEKGDKVEINGVLFVVENFTEIDDETTQVEFRRITWTEYYTS